VAGGRRFRPLNLWREDSGLVRAEVDLMEELEAVPMIDSWEPMRTVLEGLRGHPLVERIGLDIDADDAWQVAYSLVQLLPMDEGDKVRLLAADSVDIVMRELNLALNAFGGGD
jgi:Lon protease-like protein